MSGESSRTESAHALQAEELLARGKALRALAQQLLRDSGEAEDLVQQTYLAALEHPPRQPVVLSTWLKRVLRNRAIDCARVMRRRRTRERAVARAEAVLFEISTDEQLEVREQVLAAVRSLEEPYRSTIVRRYLEGQSVRDIATREACPLKTVETRLTRALQQLRARLDQRYRGDRRTWALALLPSMTMSSAATTVSSASAGGALGMSLGATMTKKLTWALLCALALFGAWGALHFMESDLWPEPSAGPQPKLSAVETNPSERESAARVMRANLSSPASLMRGDGIVEDVPATSTLGTVELLVTWFDGQGPAEGVAAMLEPSETHRARDQRILTDAAGSARFIEVPPGEWKLSTERGGQFKMYLKAGESHQVHLTLDTRLQVEGIVKSTDGSIVPGADIWLANQRRGWLGGRVIANADHAGRFVLRAISTGASLGARAPGYTPSKLIDLDDIKMQPDRASLELVLGRNGARIFGRVISSQGTVVPETLVAAGQNAANMWWWGIDGKAREGWTPITVTVDEAGFYAIDGLSPGELSISVRAPGYPQLLRALKLANDANEQVDFVLEAGARITGVVRLEDGTPVRDARVIALESTMEEDWDVWDGPGAPRSAFGRNEARTDKTGRFDLRDLPTGTCSLIAYAGGPDSSEEDYLGQDRATLQLESGTDREWHPKLSLGLCLTARIERADKKPLASAWMIRLKAESGPHPLVQRAISGDGQFCIAHLEDVLYTAILQHRENEPVRFPGLRPGTDEVLVLTLPAEEEVQSAKVFGQLDPEYLARLGPAGFFAMLNQEESSRFLLAQQKGESFRFEDVRPGRVRITLVSQNEGFYRSEWIDLAPNSKHDLGTIRPPLGGSARVEVEFLDGAQYSSALSARIGSGLLGQQLHWDGVAFVGEALPSGDHELQISGAGLYQEDASAILRIKSGAHLDHRAQMRPGRQIECVLHPAPGGDWKSLSQVVREGDRVIHQRTIKNSIDLVVPIRLHTTLPAGTFLMQVSDDQGRTKELAFTISMQGAAMEPFVFDLAK